MAFEDCHQELSFARYMVDTVTIHWGRAQVLNAISRHFITGRRQKFLQQVLGLQKKVRHNHAAHRLATHSNVDGWCERMKTCLLPSSHIRNSSSVTSIEAGVGSSGGGERDGDVAMIISLA